MKKKLLYLLLLSFRLYSMSISPIQAIALFKDSLVDNQTDTQVHISFIFSYRQRVTTFNPFCPSATSQYLTLNTITSNPILIQPREKKTIKTQSILPKQTSVKASHIIAILSTNIENLHECSPITAKLSLIKGTHTLLLKSSKARPS